jgi:hypothetical protein
MMPGTAAARGPAAISEVMQGAGPAMVPAGIAVTTHGAAPAMLPGVIPGMTHGAVEETEARKGPAAMGPAGIAEILKK